nr:putative reverse transcriptase domain-containing protein [Tanacetum cinerariifolium]
MPPSPMLSPMFNPQEYFLPEALLPPKKRGRDRSSSYTPTLPKEFEIGESSRKTSLERREEQIEEILNHLDELSLDRIKNMEDNIEGLGKGRVIIQQDFDNLETELQVTHAQVAKLQRNQLRQNNKTALDRFRINDLEQIIKEIQARHQVDKEMFSCSNYTKDYKVKFATGTLTEEALSWWNSIAQPIGIEKAYKITWTYVRRFHELATLYPTMVSNSEKMMEAFIGGLPQSIEGNVTASKPQTLKKAINIAQRLMVREKGHYANQCRKTTNNNAQGRAYMLRDINAHRDPKVVTAQVMEKKSEDKRLEDIPVVREFPDIFPEDLPSLPSVRQVEFQIDLILGATLVARIPYRLAPSKMQELSDQL